MPHQKLFAALASVAVGGMLFCGCGYGKVSPKTYEYATALYSICNQKDAKRLEKLATMVEQSQQTSEISDKEAGWLKAIIKQARGGSWETASSRARQMMNNQVERQ